MNPKLSARLNRCTSLPTLPAVAADLIELGRDPDASIEQAVAIIQLDPALCTKILRMANSALYTRGRACEDFQQAVVKLGLNATMTIALTFSLSETMTSGTETEGFNLDSVWRRSLLAGLSARVLGKRLGYSNAEELFLGAIIQDIGILALNRAVPKLYPLLPQDEQNHASMVAHELRHLGTDHAEVGAWLLERWKLGPKLVGAVRESHVHFAVQSSDVDAVVARTVNVSGPLADVWLNDDHACASDVVSGLLKSSLGLDPNETDELLQDISAELPAIEQLFEVDFLGEDDPQWVLQEAREALIVRNLIAMRETSELKDMAATLEAHAKKLEEQSKLDLLTGVYNRGYLEEAGDEIFSSALRCNAPMSVAFFDLDDFKKINDTFGHHVGDEVLSAFARILRSSVRSSDIVARYGGEEFVILLPGTEAKGAQYLCSRILQTLRHMELRLDENKVLHVTTSVGLATHDLVHPYTDVGSLTKAADQAVYSAKRAGKDQLFVYGSNPGPKVAA